MERYGDLYGAKPDRYLGEETERMFPEDILDNFWATGQIPLPYTFRQRGWLAFVLGIKGEYYA